MKSKLLLLVIFSLYFVTSKSQVNIDFIEKIQNYKEVIEIVHTDIFANDYLNPATFNIKTYMEMYPAIKIRRKNYIFDYQYFDNFLDGKPYIYVKKKNFNLMKHINKMADVRNLEEKERFNFINMCLYSFLEDPLYRAKKNIYPMNTEEGYLQYLYFYEFGELFALKWHANYKKKYVISRKQEIEEIINQCAEHQQFADTVSDTEQILRREISYCDTDALQQFLLQDSIISIQFNPDNAIIKWLEFERRGVFGRTYKIMRTHPYQIELIDEKRLVEIENLPLY